MADITFQRRVRVMDQVAVKRRGRTFYVGRFVYRTFIKVSSASPPEAKLTVGIVSAIFDPSVKKEIAS